MCLGNAHTEQLNYELRMKYCFCLDCLKTRQDFQKAISKKQSPVISDYKDEGAYSGGLGKKRPQQIKQMS